MPDPTPTCALCGTPLSNDSYGTRCEDCWVETSAECYQPLSSAVRLDRWQSYHVDLPELRN